MPTLRQRQQRNNRPMALVRLCSCVFLILAVVWYPSYIMNMLYPQAAFVETAKNLSINIEETRVADHRHLPTITADDTPCQNSSLSMPGQLVNSSTTPSFFIRTHDGGELTSMLIMRDGCFDCELLAKVKEQLIRYPDSYLLDIGGNLGLFSLLGAVMGHNVHVFEPFPDNWQRLCESVRLNGVQNYVTVYNVPLVDKPTIVSFHGPKRNKAAIGTLKVDVTATNNDSDLVRVQAVPLDSMSLPLDIPVVLKMDVERSECMALTGALNFLMKADIVWAVMELSRKQMLLTKCPKRTEIFKALTDKGLSPFMFVNGSTYIPLDVAEADHWRDSGKNLFDVIWERKVS